MTSSSYRSLLRIASSKSGQGFSVVRTIFFSFANLTISFACSFVPSGGQTGTFQSGATTTRPSTRL